MLPQSYHKIFRKHLSEQQYLTLEILLLLIQAYRQVKLSKLASLFPQPIKYESRKRNLQRFLGINKLCVKLLLFPLIKYWIRQSLTPQQLNREQRRYFHKKQYQKYGYWMVALDRTQWKGRNIFMVTLVWG
ncbi:IS4 family transposase, partial [Cylindrospermopsis raciborskii C07]